MKFSSAKNIFVKSYCREVRQEFIFIKRRSPLVCSSIVWSPLGCSSLFFTFMNIYDPHKKVRNLILSKIALTKATKLTRPLPQDIYTSQKQPSRWPRTYKYVLPQFHFYAFVKARPPTWLLLFVSEVSSSSVRWSLLALLGLVHREKQFLTSRGFRPNGGKQRCGCVQMRHKLVRALRLRAFVTTVIEERRGFLWLKARATGMMVDWLGEELVTGSPGGRKNDHTARRIAVNDYLDVPTSERLSSSRDRRYECTGIVPSETLRVSC